MPTLTEMQKQIEELVVTHGFANDPKDFPTKLLFAFVELGEATDDWKKGDRIIGVDTGLEELKTKWEALKRTPSLGYSNMSTSDLSTKIQDIDAFIKQLKPNKKYRTVEEWRAGISEELIDAMYYILDAARVFMPEQNMDEHFNKKQAKNMGRAYRYGEGTHLATKKP
jgi:hypothetical protein